MKQLRSLDLWATNLSGSDIQSLLNLPNLEYLSLGNIDQLPTLNANVVTSLILNMPSLKRVWLDGIAIEPRQRQALEAQLESVRITSVRDSE